MRDAVLLVLRKAHEVELDLGAAAKAGLLVRAPSPEPTTREGPADDRRSDG